MLFIDWEWGKEYIQIRKSSRE